MMALSVCMCVFFLANAHLHLRDTDDHLAFSVLPDGSVAQLSQAKAHVGVVQEEVQYSRGGSDPDCLSREVGNSANDTYVVMCCSQQKNDFKTELAKHDVVVGGPTEAYLNNGATSPDGSRILVSYLRNETKNREFKKGSESFAVCETGFNWGGSMFSFLCASPKVSVHSFDLPPAGAKPGTRAADWSPKIMRDWFGKDRVELVLGNSHETLTLKAQPNLRCDFVFVDGGHDYSTALADMQHFADFASPGTLMIADDCHSESAAGQGGPREAYQQMLKEKKIAHVADERSEDLNFRSVCIGRYL